MNKDHAKRRIVPAAVLMAALVTLSACGGNSADKDAAGTGTPTSSAAQTTVTTGGESAATTQKPADETKANGLTDSEIAGMKGGYRDADNENGPFYSLTVDSISADSAEIELEYVGDHLSPIYESNRITVALKWGDADKTTLVGDFEWKDSWNNAGVGTVKFEKAADGAPRATLNVRVTEEAPVNRATLATNGDKTLFWGK